MMPHNEDAEGIADNPKEEMVWEPPKIDAPQVTLADRERRGAFDGYRHEWRNS